MVEPLWIALGVATLVLLGELLHLHRIRRMALLLFGPRQRAENWVRIVPILRSVAAGLLAWGLWTLLFSIAPKTQGSDTIKSGEWNHLVLVLDVSPSMRLEDAGPTGEQSRLHRSRDILNSIFSRVAMGHYRVSVVATYSGAMPVVVDTIDAEVLQNILGDLPMHHAFKKGETRLFDGLEEAVKIAKGWEPRSTTVIVLSDGDTVPPTDMPKMPPSVGGCLVVGVGDPLVGSFVGGRNSRQDVSTLRQIAARMNGSYHNGNKKHVASGILKQVTVGSHQALLRVWSRREYALMACFLGSALLALLPLLLHLLGTRFQPGRRVRVLTGRLNPS